MIYLINPKNNALFTVFLILYEIIFYTLAKYYPHKSFKTNNVKVPYKSRYQF
jgi:hypothetical protein